MSKKYMHETEGLEYSKLLKEKILNNKKKINKLNNEKTL